jgi:hypothetical protein
VHRHTKPLIGHHTALLVIHEMNLEKHILSIVWIQTHHSPVYLSPRPHPGGWPATWGAALSVQVGGTRPGGTSY